MTLTLHCLDCGFQFTVTVAPSVPAESIAGSISCGHCRCRRWAAA
jgi:hypothetical protein